MCVNDLAKVALDSAAAGIEPAISSHKSSNALTNALPRHNCIYCFFCLKIWHLVADIWTILLGINWQNLVFVTFLYVGFLFRIQPFFDDIYIERASVAIFFWFL